MGPSSPLALSGSHCRGRTSSAAGAKKLLYQGRWEIRLEYAPHCLIMGSEADRNQLKKCCQKPIFSGSVLKLGCAMRIVRGPKSREPPTHRNESHFALFKRDPVMLACTEAAKVRT